MIAAPNAGGGRWRCPCRLLLKTTLKKPSSRSSGPSPSGPKVWDARSLCPRRGGRGCADQRCLPSPKMRSPDRLAVTSRMKLWSSCRQFDFNFLGPGPEKCWKMEQPAKRPDSTNYKVIGPFDFVVMWMNSSASKLCQKLWSETKKSLYQSISIPIIRC